MHKHQILYCRWRVFDIKATPPYRWETTLETWIKSDLLLSLQYWNSDFAGVVQGVRLRQLFWVDLIGWIKSLRSWLFCWALHRLCGCGGDKSFLSFAWTIYFLFCLCVHSLDKFNGWTESADFILILDKIKNVDVHLLLFLVLVDFQWFCHLPFMILRYQWNFVCLFIYQDLVLSKLWVRCWN